MISNWLKKKKEIRHESWELTQPASPTFAEIVSRDVTFGRWRQHGFGLGVLHPASFFRLVATCTYIFESGKYPIYQGAIWGGQCIYVTSVASSNVLSFAELPFVTSLILAGRSGFLNNGDFFNSGSCCWHHPKSELWHFLWWGKQMWCCHTLLPGV